MGRKKSPIKNFDKMCNLGNKYIVVDMPDGGEDGKVLFVEKAGVYYVRGGSNDKSECLFFADFIDHVNKLQQKRGEKE